MIDRTAFPNEQFTYSYLAGPVLKPEEIEVGVLEGNCRFALQLYYYRMQQKFFDRDDIYLPGGYKVFGEFIFKEEPIDYLKLKPGDILFAQNFRNKEGKSLNKGREITLQKMNGCFIYIPLFILVASTLSQMNNMSGTPPVLKTVRHSGL